MLTRAPVAVSYLSDNNNNDTTTTTSCLIPTPPQTQHSFFTPSTLSQQHSHLTNFNTGFRLEICDENDGNSDENDQNDQNDQNDENEEIDLDYEDLYPPIDLNDINSIWEPHIPEWDDNLNWGLLEKHIFGCR
jgi:hypothetical protein